MLITFENYVSTVNDVNADKQEELTTSSMGNTDIQKILASYEEQAGQAVRHLSGGKRHCY